MRAEIRVVPIRSTHRHRSVRTLDLPIPSEMMRVVYLDHFAGLSGAELALLRLLPALEGVDAHVVLGHDGPLVGALEEAGIRTEVIPMRAAARDVRRERLARGVPAGGVIGAIAWALAVGRRLRRLRPDLVHANSLKAGVAGGLAARLGGAPLVWQVHDRIAADALPAGAVRLVRGALHALPAAVVANSATTAATLGRARANQVRAVVAPPVAPPATPREPVPDHPFRVGILGRVAPWKGQDLFIRAFARAFPDGQAQAVVVGGAMFGEDAYEATLPRLAASLGVGERVELRGLRRDIGAELARLDVVVHASLVPEPFGQVVVETMAAGRPVVAPAAGGPSEIVTDGVDGLLVPPGDVDALAGALVRLAADPALRARLAAAGPRRAADFAPDAVAPQMRAVYAEVLARRCR